ncbi:MAG: fatty acid desaturase family protein [Planctomycetaceae bacterium]|nr:fatty acid desaturase family protein [Planctomycetaceae bacterium]
MTPNSQGAAQTPDLPVHLTIPLATRIFYATSCLIAFLLLAGLGYRIVLNVKTWSWLAIVAVPGGMLLADFLSGLIHWSADTWGSESMPVLGKRLLHPFRVHHINPADFLRRQFIDTNGDVAFMAIPVLLAAFQIPLTSNTSIAAAVFVTSFSAVGLMTNQIHQWAHMRKAPGPIRWLQRFGIILSHEAHEQHHYPPYVQNYCIATGWCNRPLMAIRFFSRLEALITWLTGLQPRHDEVQFAQAVFSEKQTS